jgi:RsiW-degrading membrane proteinase PrsW (M82 family)
MVEDAYVFINQKGKPVNFVSLHQIFAICKRTIKQSLQFVIRIYVSGIILWSFRQKNGNRYVLNESSRKSLLKKFFQNAVLRMPISGDDISFSVKEGITIAFRY